MIRCVSLVAGYVESGCPRPFFMIYGGSHPLETKEEALRSLACAFFLKAYSKLKYSSQNEKNNLFNCFVNEIKHFLSASTNDDYGDILGCGWDDMTSLKQVIEAKISTNQLLEIDENAEYDIANALNSKDAGEEFQGFIEKIFSDKEKII